MWVNNNGLYDDASAAQEIDNHDLLNTQWEIFNQFAAIWQKLKSLKFRRA
jgi:hypothetical protein